MFEAVTEAKNVRYLVVDASTGFSPYANSIQPNVNGSGSYPDDHYVWQDRSTGLYLLFITDELRDKMVGSSDWEMARGKLARELKRKSFTSPPIRQSGAITS